jgi:hypothetical protein
VPVTWCTKNLVYSNSEKGSGFKDQDVKFLGLLNNFEIFQMSEKNIAFSRINVLSIIKENKIAAVKNMCLFTLS